MKINKILDIMNAFNNQKIENNIEFSGIIGDFIDKLYDYAQKPLRVIAKIEEKKENPSNIAEFNAEIDKNNKKIDFQLHNLLNVKRIREEPDKIFKKYKIENKKMNDYYKKYQKKKQKTYKNIEKNQLENDYKVERNKSDGEIYLSDQNDYESEENEESEEENDENFNAKAEKISKNDRFELKNTKKKFF